MSRPVRTIVLASSSPYRRALLERLRIPFTVDAPGIDENARAGEDPEALVRRLALAKARAVAPRHPDALVIASDQVALLDGRVVGKPGGLEENVRQIEAASGRRVVFLTSLCLLDAASDEPRTEVERFEVAFRRLSTADIRAYVERERAFDCAGGFRAEGLGAALFERMHGDDPNSLLGLPVFRLVALLAEAGVDVLGG